MTLRAETLVNTYISPRALSEIEALLRRTQGAALELGTGEGGKISSRVLFAGATGSAIQLSAQPKVLASLKVLRRLDAAMIDFSPERREFFVRAERDVFYSYA